MKVSYGSGEITIGALMQSNPMLMLWGILVLVIFLSIVITVILLLNYRARKRERQLVKQISRLNEQLQAVIQQAGTMCWKYDIGKKRVEILKNDVMPERYMPNEYLDNVPEYFLEHQMVHPDSRREFLKLFGRINAGVKKQREYFSCGILQILHGVGKRLHILIVLMTGEGHWRQLVLLQMSLWRWSRKYPFVQRQRLIP